MFSRLQTCGAGKAQTSPFLETQMDILLTKMDKISQFTLKNKDIELLYHNGFLAYSFDHEGKAYGNKIKLPSRSVIDIASVTFLLLENALSSIENFNDSTGTREEA